MYFAIVTGVSRGLGESIAKILLKQNVHIIGISRTKNDELANLAKEKNMTYIQLSYDLGETKELKACTAEISSIIGEHSVEKLYLVNNAAVLQPIDHSRNISVADLSYHIHVNSTAPMVLMNTCLDLSFKYDLSFYGGTITSGAAKRPIYGWSAYCSTKASIDMYTQTVALEQESLETKNKVFAFNPGVMDTNMQEQIRASDPEAFKDVEQFKQYKKENHLKQAADVAQIFSNILMKDGKINSGKIYNVSDYL